MVSGIDYVLQVMGARIAGVMFVLLAACAGGSSGTTAQEPPLSNSRSVELDAAQDAACQRLAPKVTDCAIEDARATMSPQDFADMARDLDELADRNSEQYIDHCTRSPMSRRQLEVYEQCALDVTCEEFLACTDRAKPAVTSP